MANNTSAQEQLKYTVGLQVGLTVLAVIFTMLYTLPKMEATSLQIEAANQAITAHDEILNNGISYDALPSVIANMENTVELSELVTKNGEKIIPFLVKTDPSKTYSDWLTDVMNTSEDDRIRIMDAQSKINSIIPTLSPLSRNQTIKSVTLRDYVTFVEKILLSNNGITSFSPIGISGVTYQETEEGGLAHPVGVFTTDIELETNNANIIKLLNLVSSLGDPSVLSEKDISSNPPAIMSNPLVTIESLNLEKVPDSDNPSIKNTGNIVLNFYVRGSSSTDRDYLIEAFNKRKNALAREIGVKIEECKANSSCVSLDALQNVQKKFLQFDDSLAKILQEQSENTIEVTYIIAQQISLLQSLRSEFENIK